MRGSSFTFAIESILFRRVAHLLMCLPVLLCPAMGGSCCGSTSVETVAADVDTCQHCCCTGKADHPQQPSPVAPEGPNQCRDCFCAGALPPAFETPMPQIDCARLIAFIFAEYGRAATTCVDRTFRNRSDFGDGFKPPNGRALLTSFCTLLL